MAIAREATFWGVPAIGISRDAAGAPAGECGAIANLLRVLWEGTGAMERARACGSPSTAARLPAPLVQAHVGRDKIGAACETLESTADTFAFRLARGRPGTSTEGDERAARVGRSGSRWCGTAGPQSRRSPRATVEAWGLALR
jgi:5'-nucleotidase